MDSKLFTQAHIVAATILAQVNSDPSDPTVQQGVVEAFDVFELDNDQLGFALEATCLLAYPTISGNTLAHIVLAAVTKAKLNG